MTCRSLRRVIKDLTGANNVQNTNTYLRGVWVFVCFFVCMYVCHHLGRNYFFLFLLLKLLFTAGKLVGKNVQLNFGENINSGMMKKLYWILFFGIYNLLAIL